MLKCGIVSHYIGSHACNFIPAEIPQEEPVCNHSKIHNYTPKVESFPSSVDPSNIENRRQPYLSPKSMQNNSPKLIRTAIKAIILDIFGVQVEILITFQLLGRTQAVMKWTESYIIRLTLDNLWCGEEIVLQQRGLSPLNSKLHNPEPETLIPEFSKL